MTTTPPEPPEFEPYETIKVKGVALLDPAGSHATQDPEGSPVAISAGEPCSLRVRWSVGEPGVGRLGGRFLVRAYAESLGPGPELELSDGPVPVDVSTGVSNPSRPEGRDFVVDIVVPAHTFPGEWEVRPRTYKIVVAVTHEGEGGPTVLAGFSEGPVVHVRHE